MVIINYTYLLKNSSDFLNDPLQKKSLLAISYFFISSSLKILCLYSLFLSFFKLACVGTHSGRCWYNCSNNCGGLNNACDHVTGICKDSCDAGYYGYRCLTKCSKTCARNDKACERFSGKCLQGCKANHYGDKCWQKCKGRNCAGTNTACDSQNRRCKTGCDPGLHGTHCGIPCSKQCAGIKDCDRTNGTCLSGCVPGYTGAKCDKGKIEVTLK